MKQVRNHLNRHWFFVCRLVLILLGCLMLISPEVGATYFRHGHLVWRNNGTNKVEFVLTMAFRRNSYQGSGADGFPVRGDIIREDVGRTVLCFGDDVCTGILYFSIIEANPAENWIVGMGGMQSGEEMITHHYDTAGEFIAFSESCCRIPNLDSSNSHINNPGGSYRLETEVLLCPR